MSNDLDANLATLESFAEVVALEDSSHTLADEVLKKLQDGSYGYEDVVGRFNDCMMELAGSFLFPDLERMTEVLTDPNVNNIRLPPEYHRNLRYCHSISYNREIRICGSVIQIFRKYSRVNQTGVVRQVAVKGRNLYYQRVPSSGETLLINFWAYPEKLRSRWDKPLDMPYHLARKLLVHYALKEMFDEIEDGIEGEKANTRYHDAKYKEALVELEDFIGPEEHEPQEFDEEIVWDNFF